MDTIRITEVLLYLHTGRKIRIQFFMLVRISLLLIIMDEKYLGNDNNDSVTITHNDNIIIVIITQLMYRSNLRINSYEIICNYSGMI